MKVTHIGPPNTSAVEIEKSKQADKTSAKSDVASSATHATQPGVSRENVEISDNARLMKKANELAHATPDIRRDKISALKKSIADGTYQVDSAKVADRLVDEHLATDFGKNDL